jgi:hypothetical protein
MKKIHMIMRLSCMNANINVFRRLTGHVFLYDRIDAAQKRNDNSKQGMEMEEYG